MKTPFDLIQRLSAWFLRADRDIALPSGRKITITGANVEITSGGLVITGGNITVSGTVDGVDISAHAANANAHHNQSHVLATTSALGGDHTVSGLTAGQVLRATGSSTARFQAIQSSDLPAIDHGALTGLADDDHTQYLQKSTLTTVGDIYVHNGSAVTRLGKGTNGQVLTVNTSTATDLEWATPSAGVTDHGALTGLADDDHTQYHNNTRGDARYYRENEFSSSTGAAAAPLKTSAAGLLEIKGIGLGKTAAADEVTAAGDIKTDGDLRAADGIVTGSTSINPAAGRVVMAESSTPGTPSSGFGVLWVSTSGKLWFKNDAGTATQIT